MIPHSQLYLPQEAISPHRVIWESYMGLSYSKGYAQGELNLVDIHDYFDTNQE